MRIQNNITAMNTHRMYTINNDNVAKSAEKLSSGYRINRAGDDAAGLAISEKMRSQIRGLNMATKNSQDAISLVQTAEGALQETQNMLQRMNELAVQAATGTNQEIDRNALAKEFEQLKREINDVAEQTTFNNMKILDGSRSYKGYVRSAATAGVTVTQSDVIGSSSGGGSQVLGATVSGLHLDSADSAAATTIAAGQKLTLTGEYTDADGNKKTITLEATAGAGGEKVTDLIGKLEGTDEASKAWSAEVDANGNVTLTATKDPGIGEGAKMNLALSTDDTGVTLKTPAAEGTVSLAKAGDAIEGTKDTFEIDASAATFSNTSTSAAVTVEIGDETVNLTFKRTNSTSNQAFSGATALSMDPVTNDKWDVSFDAATQKITFTAKEPPAADAEPLKAADITMTWPNGAGTLGTVTPGSAASVAEAKGTAPAIDGASLGTNIPALAANNAGEATTITATLDDGSKINFTATAQKTGVTVAEMFADGVVSDDGKWSVKVDGTTGDLTFTSLADAGATDLGKAAAISMTSESSAIDTGITGNVADIVNGKITNGEDAPAAGGDKKDVTIGVDFAKLKAGDTVTVKVGNNTINITKTAADTDRAKFMESLKSQVEAAGGKVKGNAIVFEGLDKGLEVSAELSADATDDEETFKTNALRIQVGALENEQLDISIDAMNTAGLGLDDAMLSLFGNTDDENQDLAGKAITAVRAAINKVSDQRATLGAMQNRLDHKIANLKVSSENLSAAESRIRDVDMASEMTNFTKNNILSQAATAMLAQANALPQNVLSLLG